MYLIKTDRRELLVSVWAGLGFAAVLSGVVAQFLGKHRHQELFEGVMAMVAAILVASLTFYVAKNARHFKTNIQTKMDKAHEKEGFWRFAAVFGFVILMVAREGVEVALLLNVISFKYEMNANPMYIGAVIGTIAAAVLGFLWIRYSHLINIGKFMKVTSVFLVFFTVHLFLYGIHELGEAKALPFVNNHYWAELTEDIVKKGFFSWVITYGMVFIPAWFLATGYLNSRKLKAQA